MLNYKNEMKLSHNFRIKFIEIVNKLQLVNHNHDYHDYGVKKFHIFIEYD